ncbi:MAG: ABC-ATPase domain-containing protein [Candidatus Latescibacter sp.]|nr:ABC-ATPase domain-containing protein [Candidatus Latescibacter sp.]
MEISIKKIDDLRKVLFSLDGQRIGAYRELAGEYDYGDFILTVDYIPDDPSKQSSRMRARVSLDTAKFPRDVFNTRSREIGARDFLVRAICSTAARFSRPVTGIKGGKVIIDRPGQEILENTALVLGNDCIEVRFSVDLPVKRERIPGQQAAALFIDTIPRIIRECLIFKNLDGEGLAEWIETNEDADAARLMLDGLGLAAFVADGSVLPRISFVDPRALVKDAAPFKAPDELAVTLDLPNAGKVRGMGIPKGITLVTGGGAQGKSTLLDALALGVYNHIPEDGRELVVTAEDAVGIRAEEGRRIENVDISPFFSSLERGMDTRHFSAPFASPAVSQAANIMEAVEIGTSLLIIDESTSAADIMDHDARMQELIPADQETVTTLVDILPLLKSQNKISVIIAANCAGDYLEIADTVISLNRFQPFFATTDAKRIVAEHPSGRTSRAGDFPSVIERLPLSHSLEPYKNPSPDRSRFYGRGFIQYGDEFIDCSKVVQLVSHSQGRSISRSIALVHRLMDSSKSLADAVEKVMERVNGVGLDTLSGRLMGDLASFRPYELAAAINRMRRVKVK